MSDNYSDWGGAAEPGAAEQSDYGGGWGSEPADSSDGVTHEPVEQKPKYDKDEYETWKTTTNTDLADYTALGDAGKQAQYLDWRYEEWNAGAHEVMFSKYEADEFRKRDASGGGPSDARKTNAAEWASQEAVKTYYYQTDDPSQPGYIQNTDPTNPGYVNTTDPDAAGYKSPEYFEWMKGKPAGAYRQEMNRNGGWDLVLEKDFSSILDQLWNIQQFEFSTFDEWQAAGEGRDMHDISDSHQYNQLTKLADELSAGSFDETALQDAMKYAAQGLGFGSGEEMQETLAGMRNQGIGDMQGMSEEEMAVRQGMNRETFRQQELTATRALESIRASGKSTAQYLMRADEYISQLTSQKLQADAMLAQENWERQKAEWDAQQRQYEFMVQSGNMSRTEYLNLYQQNRALGMQAYAMQINAMFQENQEVFQEYQTDMQAMAANLQNMYAAMNAEMGFEQWAIDTATQIYNNNLLPVLTELQIYSQEQAAQMQEDYIQMMQQGNMMNFVGQIIGGIGKIFNPFG